MEKVGQGFTMKRKFGLLFILVFFLLLGCIKKDFTAPKIKSAGKVVITSVDLSSTCSTFECKPKSLTDQFIISLKTFFGLLGEEKPTLGNCQVGNYDTDTKEGKEAIEILISNETIELFKSNGTIEGYSLRYFMFGAGPSIAVADELRKYCNGNLGLGVQWLGGNRTENATEPNIDQVKCATETDLLPLLAYGIKDGDLDYTIALSNNLKGKGAVLVAPGALFSKKDKSYNDPACDFAVIKNRCSNCLTTAFIRLNDTTSLDSYSEKINILAAGAPECSQFIPLEKIDSIAVDVNLKEFECDSDTVVLDTLLFTDNLSKKFKKPIIIYFRGGQEKGKNGCEWTTDKVMATNSKLYLFSPFFLSTGVIAIVNGEPAMFDQTSKQSLAIKQSMDLCKFYYDQTTDQPALMKLVFPYGESSCPSGNYEMTYLYQSSITETSPDIKPFY